MPEELPLVEANEAPTPVSAGELQPLSPSPQPEPATFEGLSLPGAPAARRSDAAEALAVASVPRPEVIPERPLGMSVEAPVFAPMPPASAPPQPPASPPADGAGEDGSGKPPTENDEKRMTLIEHLEELRRVLIVSLIAWGIGSVVGLVLSHWIVLLLTKPLDILHLKAVVLSPMGFFTIHLKVGLLTGLVLALPVILQQSWKFVAPGLKPKERRLAGPLMLSSLLLFAFGGVLAFGFMFIGIKLIQATSNWTGVQYLPELTQYLGLMVILMLAFGITFEFPVALVLLAMVGMVSSARLRRSRRVAYMVIAAVGYFHHAGRGPRHPPRTYSSPALAVRRIDPGDQADGQMSARHDGRSAEQLRPVNVETNVNLYAEGSALISAGNTRVLCTATVEDKVPPHKKGSGEGWVTAEYAMLPRATTTRNQRDRGGRIDGRSQEIQRLVGRAFRAGIDLRGLGDRTVTVDCDVLQADAGTRCASITGGFIALYLALQRLQKNGQITTIPVRHLVSAVSVGVVGDVPLLDLNYAEDFRAEVDMNCVATETGNFIEIQGTGERRPFSRDEGDALLDLAATGIEELTRLQRQVLGL